MGFIDRIEGFASNVKKKRESVDKRLEQINNKKNRLVKAGKTISKATGVSGAVKRIDKASRRDDQFGFDIGFDDGFGSSKKKKKKRDDFDFGF